METRGLESLGFGVVKTQGLESLGFGGEWRGGAVVLGDEAGGEAGEEIARAGGGEGAVGVVVGPVAVAVGDDGEGGLEDDDAAEASGERGRGLEGVGGGIGGEAEGGGESAELAEVGCEKGGGAKVTVDLGHLGEAVEGVGVEDDGDGILKDGAQDESVGAGAG